MQCAVQKSSYPCEALITSRTFLFWLQEGAKLVVNCFAGLSRSSSSVLAYLILKKDLTANAALTAVKMKRDVWPSNAFLTFLSKLSNDKHCLGHVEDDQDFGDIVFRDVLRNEKAWPVSRCYFADCLRRILLTRDVRVPNSTSLVFFKTKWFFIETMKIKKNKHCLHYYGCYSTQFLLSWLT